MFPQPEGDYVISQDVPGYAVLGAALVLMIVGIATLPRPVKARIVAKSLSAETIAER